MATQHKKIENQPNQKGTYLHKDNWEVMKPFVHFAFKAIAVIGGTLLAIVKLLPKALEHKHEDKNEKVIKI
jgi:hypothetical protein